jgi:TPR repeat protein
VPIKLAMAATRAFWKIAAPVTCVAVIGGAAILWSIHKENVLERKFAETARTYHIRADQGDADAQYRLGFLYQRGQGAPPDYTEAARWYRKSADQGYAKAQYGLAFLYHQGQGVPRDDAEALRWSRKAADQGNAEAQTSLGNSYAEGLGVPQDDAEALRWYRQAAGQGEAMAQYALGVMYYQGQGVPQDRTEAVRWYRQAAGQGEAMAQYALGVMYYRGQGVPQDYAEAERWFRPAADHGDKSAQGALTIMYFKGRGVPKNYPEALHWLGKIAASCLEVTNGGPLGFLLLPLSLALTLPIKVVRRRWPLVTWLPWALLSAAVAVMLTHDLLVPQASLALGLLASVHMGSWRVLWFAFLAGGSAICAVRSVVEATRGSKPAGNQGQPTAPLEPA